MVTISDIEKTYMKRIPYKFRSWLIKYIDNDKVQGYLKKALGHGLTESDYKELYRIGYHPDRKPQAEFPGLNYICVTFIHPVTKWQAITEKVERLKKELITC